jgi:hypothetical protein
MTDGIDAAVKGTKTAGSNAMGDLFTCQTGRAKLTAGHDAMLAVGQVPDDKIRMLVALYVYGKSKVISVGHGRRFAALAAHLLRGASSNGSEEDAKRSRVGSRAWRPRWALPPVGGG